MKARVAALLIVLVPAALFLGLGVYHLDTPSLQHDETIQAAEATLFLQGSRAQAQGTGGWKLAGLPWMTIEYLGALKTYLLAAVFSVFGVGPMVLRGANLAFGLLALVCTILLTRRLYGEWAAGALGLWLATDPAFVLLSRYDEGPSFPTVALKMAGLLALVVGASRTRRQAAWMFAGGLLFGLCLWDKMHFLWFLAGVSAALVLWVPPERWRRREFLVPVLAGFLVGAFPTILFNIVYPLQALNRVPEIAHSLPEYLTRLNLKVREAWMILGWMFGGGGSFPMIAGTPAPELPWRGAALWALVALAAACLPFAKRASGIAFWTTAFAVAFLAAAVNPLGVQLHHMPMLYPLPHLAAASALAWALQQRRLRAPAFALAAPVLSVALAGNLLLMSHFFSAVERTGGAVNWYTGIRDVARYCAARGRPVYTTHGLYFDPLVVYSGGAVVPLPAMPKDDRPADAAAQEAAPEYLKDKGALLVVLKGPDRLNPRWVNARAVIDAQLARYHAQVRPVLDIPYSDGSPWTTVYEIQ